LVNGLKQSQSEDYPWARKVQKYIASGQKARALRVLERVIEFDMPLFQDDMVIQEDRRFAWLYRIDLLQEWGRLSEALAWTCLECELNPNNVAAQALKERLKHFLNLQLSPNWNSFKTNKRDVTEGIWRGVAGMREVKAILERDIILPLQEPELYKEFKVHLPRGVLFYGPPGCGKTFIARKLAEILKFQFIEKKPSDLASTYVHGGQLKTGALFEDAKRRAPALIFLDELDAFVPNRGDLGDHHYRAEVNEFLVQLNDCWRHRILVIAATNLLENIDSAVLRPGRMDKKVFIGPPDLEARVELIKLYMQDRPQKDIDWLKIAERTDFYTSAELSNIIDEAAKIALHDLRPILDEDIYSSIDKNPPSLNKERIEKIKTPIGFVS
jgi:SpoVK/Ycf46/Vps4 family AAA+-type ATPase